MPSAWAVETSKISKAADTAAGADTENAGFSRECKDYGSWNIFICFKRTVASFISNELKWISKTSKQTKTEEGKITEGISVQQTSQIFCCIQHILRRQDISYGSLHGYLKPRRQSSISWQLFLRCLCQRASYSSQFLNPCPVAATGCGARAEKPAVSQRGLEGPDAGEIRDKAITCTGSSAVLLARG